ncbi:hypothetical protein BX070DRAFT_256690 [Coemansia spiralis]|nr:hypothetical protein BX070DRAFT_256690 [Coemansia spiralis]
MKHCFFILSSIVVAIASISVANDSNGPFNQTFVKPSLLNMINMLDASTEYTDVPTVNILSSDTPFNDGLNTNILLADQEILPTSTITRIVYNVHLVTSFVIDDTSQPKAVRKCKATRIKTSPTPTTRLTPESTSLPTAINSIFRLTTSSTSSFLSTPTTTSNTSKPTFPSTSSKSSSKKSGNLNCLGIYNGGGCMPYM